MTRRRSLMKPRYFVMRLTRFGPLLPARLHEIAHEPGEPSNSRDRWPATVLEADVGGERLPPEDITDRFYWPRDHWKALQSISQAEYEHRFNYLRWCETNRPDDPALRPRQRVDAATVALPSFENENDAVR